MGKTPMVPATSPTPFLPSYLGSYILAEGDCQAQVSITRCLYIQHLRNTLIVGKHARRELPPMSLSES